MKEPEPRILFDLDWKRYRMTRKNTGLFVYAGQAAAYNHIRYIDERPRPDGNHRALFIFEGNRFFHQIAGALIRNDFTIQNDTELPELFTEDLYYWDHYRDLGEDIVPYALDPRELGRLMLYAGFLPISPEADTSLASEVYQLHRSNLLKPKPSAAEVPYQVFECFMQQADRGVMTREQALAAVYQILSEPNSESSLSE